ncbi:MAG TPA: phosphoribosylformylglycinamidine synthase subunit PurL [Bacteroidales bacterium]|nr:phosphoribosylformylglycinamidine synthase subunit PurL [Bacteroidales bacterium]
MRKEKSETIVNLETARMLGLDTVEFEKIQQILGRMPNFNELSVYSVMWSEHCSYKNSVFWLKKLPKEGPQILAKAGEENAGMVDIGEGMACVFKIESHNHPSAVEPYQGAATGVGGINRDIFTMGARPIAQLNSLRFGNLALDRTKHLVKGVVKGIGDYGNAFGVPVVAGETNFDDCYNQNILVNAMSVGVVKSGNTVSATSKGVGNPVFIVGSSTGKDGIHGATFASVELTENSAEDLPSVQVGDPFQEKLLLEASLELIRSRCVIGMQDMGAAGIVCSTSEMSAKGGHGMDIYLDKVPLRQKNMKPWEILLSESQERMLVVIEKGKEDVALNTFKKWDLNCVEIGKVIKGGMLNYYMNGELVAQIPAESLVLGGGAPVYEREYKEPEYFSKTKKFNINSVPEPADLRQVAKLLLANPNICSKKWIWEQYDSMVGTKNMTTNRPADAAVVNLKGTDKALVMTVDCNARYVHADPRIGTEIAVAEAARNIACAGGKPLAITNCLNFGNPYNPEVYWQFVNAIKGMSNACKKFGTPVTGGNVSFYNQSNMEGNVIPVFPTPVIGMLGILNSKKNMMTMDFKRKGDLIYMLGEARNDINSSQYLLNYHKVKLSPPPYFNMDREFVTQHVLHELINSKLINSAHDVTEGGLFVALFESSMHNELGFDITTDCEIREDAFLFGEAQGRIIVSVSQDNEGDFIDFVVDSKASFTLLGHVTKGDMRVDDVSFGHVKEAKMIYDHALESYLK